MAMTTLDERLLVEAHNGGDADAFVSIVNEYSPSLYAHAMMRLGEPRAAEDAVQETFLRAYRAMPRFDGEFHLRAWLHRILTNVCFDEGDRRRREVRTLDRMAAFVDPAVPPADEVVDLDRAFAQREVASALASLPEAYREALELRYVEQLSFREVADVTGVSEENARARVHRGRGGAPTSDQWALRVRSALHPCVAQGRARGSSGVVERRARSRHGDVVCLGSRAAGPDGHSHRRRAQWADVDEGRHRRRCRRRGSDDGGSARRVDGCRSHVLARTRAGRRRARARERRRTAWRSAGHDGRHRSRVDSTGRSRGDAAGRRRHLRRDTATTDTGQPIDQASDQQTFSAPPAATAAAAAPAPNTSTPAKSGDAATTPDAGTTSPPVPARARVRSLHRVSPPRLRAIRSRSPARPYCRAPPARPVGSLTVTPGASADDPVRLDGTLMFSASDGTTQSIRLAMRAVATTDSTGVTTYAVSAGRYEITDGAGVKSTGSLTGSMVVGLANASSFTLTLI